LGDYFGLACGCFAFLPFGSQTAWAASKDFSIVTESPLANGTYFSNESLTLICSATGFWSWPATLTFTYSLDRSSSQLPVSSTVNYTIIVLGGADYNISGSTILPPMSAGQHNVVVTLTDTQSPLQPSIVCNTTVSLTVNNPAESTPQITATPTSANPFIFSSAGLLLVIILVTLVLVVIGIFVYKRKKKTL
jgi:hypothetical protein